MGSCSIMWIVSSCKSGAGLTVYEVLQWQNEVKYE